MAGGVKPIFQTLMTLMTQILFFTCPLRNLCHLRYPRLKNVVI